MPWERRSSTLRAMHDFASLRQPPHRPAGILAGRARRVIVASTALLVAAFTVGCSASQESPSTGSAGSAESNEISTDAESSAFCAEADNIASDLEIGIMTEIEDPTAFPSRMAAASERFSTIDPPAAIAEPWQALSRLFAFAAEGLEGKDIQNEDQVRDALSSNSEEMFALVLLTPGAIEAVGVQLQRDCAMDLGYPEPAIEDACAAIDAPILEAIFGGPPPEGSPMRWSGGTTECSWESADIEVGLVIGSASMLRTDVLTDMAPLETVSADQVVEIYDGALGPFRFAAGRTALSEVGDVGVLVSVRTGDAHVEAEHAVAVASAVAGEVN